jgi:hypothetical protein
VKVPAAADFHKVLSQRGVLQSGDGFELIEVVDV